MRQQAQLRLNSCHVDCERLKSSGAQQDPEGASVSKDVRRLMRRMYGEVRSHTAPHYVHVHAQVLRAVRCRGELRMSCHGFPCQVGTLAICVLHSDRAGFVAARLRLRGLANRRAVRHVGCALLCARELWFLSCYSMWTIGM